MLQNKELMEKCRTIIPFNLRERERDRDRDRDRERERDGERDREREREREIFSHRQGKNELRETIFCPWLSFYLQHDDFPVPVPLALLTKYLVSVEAHVLVISIHVRQPLIECRSRTRHPNHPGGSHCHCGLLETEKKPLFQMKIEWLIEKCLMSQLTMI